MTKVIGKYQILHKLGEGGMGTVYLATDSTVKRKVAIKIIKPGNSHLAKRMMREAQATASLVHPNIVKVYEVLMYNELPCLVMEYLPGLTLREYLDENKISLNKKIKIFIKIVNAVEYAHKQDLIHRDIKPENIIVDREGKPYLMDFGLVKRLKVDSSLTQTGVIMGSPTYMSPEQARGETRKLDCLVDIYSLGVVLYELITDTLLVQGEHIAEILKIVTTEKPIPPRKINNEISRSLENICLKSLQKKKKNRYQSADILAQDLQCFLRKKTTIADSWFWQKRVKQIFICLCIPACYVTFYFWINQKNHDFDLNIKVTDTKNLVKNAFNLMRYELNDEALQKFAEILKNKNIKNLSQQKIYLGMLEIYKRQKKWKKVDEIYNKYFSGKKNIQADMAMARMYFEKNEYRKISKYMNYNVLSKDKIATDFFYLQAQVFYEEKKYEKSITALLELEKIISDEHIKNLAKLLSAKAYFQEHIKSKNIEYVAKSRDILEKLKSDLPNNVELYEYLGRCSLWYKKFNRAKKFFEKCISLLPEESLYHSLLSKAQIELQDFDAAYKSITSAIDADPINNIANTSFLNMAYKNSHNQQERYSTMSYYGKIFVTIPKPQFIKKYFYDLEKKYKDQYDSLRWLREKHNAEGLRIQKSFFKTTDKMHAYFNIVRHSILMPKEIEIFISNKISNGTQKKRSLKILQTFVKKKIKDITQANYYRLVRLYLYKDKDIFWEWKEGKFASIDRLNLRVIFEGDSDPFFQYLAAKALLYLGDTYYLEQHLRSMKYSLQKLIATVAFREEKISVGVSSIIKYLQKKKKFSLFDLLVINATYQKSESQLPKIIALLDQIMRSNENIKARLRAAEVIFRMTNISENVWERARNIFLQAMDEKKISYRFFSHYYFWRNVYIHQKIDSYWSYYKKAWEDKNSIVSIMIILIKDDILPLSKKREIKNYIITRINQERQQGLSLTVLQLQAVRVLFYNFSDSKLSYVAKEHSLLKIMAYNNKILQQSEKVYRNINALENNMRFLKKNLHLVGKKNNDDTYYKMFVYYLSALFGFHTLDILENENDTIKAHIFQNLCLTKYGILKNLGQLSFIIEPIMTKEVNDTWSNKAKLRVIKKYTKSKNKTLRQSALMAMYVYSSDEKKENLFRKYMKKNKDDKKMLARCIHDFIKLMTFSRLLHPDEIESLNTYYYKYLRELRKKKANHSVVLQHFVRAIKLNPENTTYLFEQSILWTDNNNNIQNSVSIWKKIIKEKISSRETLVARLRLSEFYSYTHKRSIAVKKVEEVLAPIIYKDVQDTLLLKEIVNIYLSLKLWKNARFLFEYLFFLNSEKQKLLFLDHSSLTENDKARVMKYVQYFH